MVLAATSRFEVNLMIHKALSNLTICNCHQEVMKSGVSSDRHSWLATLTLITSIFVISETTCVQAQLRTLRPAPSAGAHKCTALNAQHAAYRGCACRMKDSGEIYNLRGIIDNCTNTPGGCRKPKYTVEGKTGWFYSYHPCDTFSLFQNETDIHPGFKPCKDVAAARWTRLSEKQCYTLGTEQSAVFEIKTPNATKFIASNLTVTFRDKKTKYGMTISLICNRTRPQYDATFKYLGKYTKPSLTYYFSLEGKCCCPNACAITYSPSTKPGPSKQFYWIIAVAAGILLIVVIIAVAYFMCVKKRKTSEKEPLLA